MSTETMERVMMGKSNFDTLMSDALEIQSKCQDFNVTQADKTSLFYTETGNLWYKSDEVGARVTSMTPYAFSQLCAKLGIPPRYMEKCIDAGMMYLTGDNINSWIESFGKNIFVREYDNTIRGILSDRYSVLDTPDILAVLSDTLDTAEFRVSGSVLNPERFHARILQTEPMNIEDEVLFGGIQVDSSDVGRSVLSVQFFIYKQVCTNGMVVSQGGGDLFQQKHMGISPILFKEELSESVKRIPFLIENAKDLIIRAKEKKAEYAISTLNQAELLSFIERVKTKTKLSDEAVEKVIATIPTYGESKWGLVNAITEVAQDYTLERRIELEKTAGSILAA